VKLRNVVLALLASLSIILFLDRICIAVAGPRMQTELDIPPDRWGWILGAFMLAYGLFEIPTGAMGDRYGQRSVVTRIVLWWSSFTALTGVVSGFLPLVTVRFLFGMGEAGAYPNATGSIARWFPVGERARAQGWVLGAGRVGGALTPLLVVPIQRAFGWRASFWIFGLLGVVWAVLWHRFYRDIPAAHPRITSAEQAEIGAVAPGPGPGRTPWRVLVRARTLWLIVAMYGFYAWGPWFYFSWLQTWLVRGRGFSEVEMGAWSTLPFLLGAAANLAGGRLSDRMARRDPRGRSRIGLICAIFAALCLTAAALLPGKLAAILGVTVGFGAMDLMLPSAWAVCLDVGSEYAGAVSGAMNSAGALGGALCAVVFGYIVRATGSYDLPLLGIAGALLLSGLLFSRIDPRRRLG
jgi:MFS transporter, ACS family, glucarate transporter